MKGLKTLIKLHKRNLDELRRKMASLESQKVQLLQVSANLEASLREEIKMASQTPEWGQFFGDYSNRIKLRQQDIAQEVKKLDKQMEALNVDITREFSELKKYEIALDNAQKREKAEAERREGIELDEIAGQQFRRKTEEQS